MLAAKYENKPEPRSFKLGFFIGTLGILPYFLTLSYGSQQTVNGASYGIAFRLVLVGTVLLSYLLLSFGLL